MTSAAKTSKKRMAQSSVNSGNPETLLQADALTLSVKAEGDKLRVVTNSWEDYRAVLVGQELVLVNVGGQVHVLRRERTTHRTLGQIVRDVTGLDDDE